MQRNLCFVVPMVSLLLAFATSCSNATAPLVPDEAGIIDHFGERDGVLVVPGAPRAGQAFTVTVRTYGGGCTVAAGMGVRYSGTTAILTPVDNHVTRFPPGTGCLDVLRRLDHVATLLFPTSGPIKIRVEGRATEFGAGQAVVSRHAALETTIQLLP